MEIAIINGPNLNLIGKREPLRYGKQAFESYFSELQNLFPDLVLNYFQSNSEGELIDILQELGYVYPYIIFNPAAYTHTSIAIADTIAAIDSKVIEVHITNIFSREEFRKNSFTAPHCWGMISGFGLKSYFLAIEAILQDFSNE